MQTGLSSLASIPDSALQGASVLQSTFLFPFSFTLCVYYSSFQLFGAFILLQKSLFFNDQAEDVQLAFLAITVKRS